MTFNNKERARRAGSKTFHRFQCPTVRPVLMVKKSNLRLIEKSEFENSTWVASVLLLIHGGRHGERFIKNELTL